MDTEVVMSMMAACAALAGVLVSITALTQKQRAEREFLTVLLARETAAARLRELRSEITKDGAVSSAELQNLIGSLEILTNELSREHKVLIGYGLRQRSIRGRARYAAKLMNRAGIGSGSLPVAIP
jgi:hypothetical protein